jgi:hypothetical protein
MFYSSDRRWLYFLGKLTKVSGSMPHAKGEIRVALEIEQGKLKAEVELPAGLGGSFEWHGDRRALQSGRTSVTF